MKKLMYAASGEQELYLVWEMLAGKPTLAVICTTEADLDRYVTSDRRAWLGRTDPIYVEKVMANHLYGANDLAITMRLLRRSTSGVNR